MVELVVVVMGGGGGGSFLVDGASRGGGLLRCFNYHFLLPVLRCCPLVCRFLDNFGSGRGIVCTADVLIEGGQVHS